MIFETFYTMSNITDDQIHEVFTAFDEDGSGNLSMTELNNALRLLGIDLPEEELTDKYHIDDDPESLTEEEFTLFIRDRIGDIDFRQRCQECLNEFVEDDSDTTDVRHYFIYDLTALGVVGKEGIQLARGKLLIRQGSLTRDQMKIILTQRGSHPMDDEEAEALMNDFDIDGNGVFNITEMANLMYSEQLQGQADENQDVQGQADENPDFQGQADENQEEQTTEVE